MKFWSKSKDVIEVKIKVRVVVMIVLWSKSEVVGGGSCGRDLLLKSAIKIEVEIYCQTCGRGRSQDSKTTLGSGSKDEVMFRVGGKSQGRDLVSNSKLGLVAGDKVVNGVEIGVRVRW